MIRIVLFGTPEFASILAEELHNDSNAFSIVGCVTAPDALVGRKKVLSPSAIALWATKNTIPTLKPTSLKDPEFQRKLLSWNADVWLVVAYGKILPESFLGLLPDRVLNIHPSLLPKYRGSSPLQATLRNGDQIAGTTLMQMDAEMDHGPIIAQRQMVVEPNEKYLDFSQRMARESARMVQESLEDFLSNLLQPNEQVHEEATYVSMIRKEDGSVDWSNSASDIYNLYRAYHVWPGVFTYWKGQKVELEMHIPDLSQQLTSGTWMFQDTFLWVGAGVGRCCIKSLKPAGKNWLTPSQWIQKAGEAGSFDQEIN